MSRLRTDKKSASGHAQKRVQSIWKDKLVNEVVIVLPHTGPDPFDSASTGIDICVHKGEYEIKVLAFSTTPVPGRGVETLAALEGAMGHLESIFSVDDFDLRSIAMPALPAHIGSVFCVRIPRTAILPDQTAPIDNDYAITAMDLAIGAIQRVLHAYLIATEDPRIDYNSLQKFGSFAYITFVDSANRIISGRSFTLLPEVEYKRPRDYLARIDDGIATEMSEHPIDRVVLWRLRAMRAYQVDRDDISAVLFLNTSVEMLIGAIYRAMLRDDERAGQSRVKKAVDQFRPRLREVGERLHSGPWNLNDASSPVGRYLEQLYGLRGRIVHSGYLPTSQETETAFEAGGKLRDDLERRVVDARCRFPTTCLLLNSRHSLMERNLFNRRVREVHEQMVRNEDPRKWFLPNRS